MRRFAILSILGVTAFCCNSSAIYGDGQLHALLVGVTRYPALDNSQNLTGPANDVQMMKETLRAKFGTDESRIVVLSESQPREMRPTYENISREFSRLAEKVKRGDQVVILLSGHGSQDLDDDPDSPIDREVDGLDEVFLPSDMKGWNGEIGSIENSIRDDQISEWLTAIRSAGASILFISDSCHSDTQTRELTTAETGSAGTARTRKIDLIPKEYLSRSRARTISRTESHQATVLDQRPDGGLIAFFAAQSNQTTPDWFRAPGAEKGEYMGLLTYTVCQILNTTGPSITYRELGQRIHQQYISYQRVGIGSDVPRPSMEGTDLDRLVLGSEWKPNRSRLRFRTFNNQLRLSGGTINGLTRGTILRLLPVAGESEQETLGWAVVESVQLRESTARPVDFDPTVSKWERKLPTDNLPRDGRCEIESVNFGKVKIQAALDASFPANDPFRQQIETYAQNLSSPIELVALEEAEFHILRTDNRIVLQRSILASGQTAVAAFDAGPVDDSTLQRIDAAFKRIWRATSLVDVSTRMRPHNSSRSLFPEAIDVEVSIQRQSIDDQGRRQWEAVNTTAGDKLVVGEKIRFVIRNHSRSAVRVTVLYVGDDYGIYPLFPSAPGINNTIAAGKPGEAAELPLSEDGRPVQLATRMPERLVVLTTRADDSLRGSSDYTYLKQSPLNAMWVASAGTVSSRGVRTRPWDGPSKAVRGESLSPLARFLDTAAFRPELTRAGVGAPEVPDYSLSVTTWESVSALDPLATGTELAAPASAEIDTRPWKPEVARPSSRGIGQRVYQKVAPAIVVVRTANGHGTGFVVSKDGWILTNHHVVADAVVDRATGARTAEIHMGRLKDGSMELINASLVADIYKWSEEKDLALLKLRKLPDGISSLPVISLAEAAPTPGSDCVAIGHPASGVLWTLRTGEIAGSGTWPADHISFVMKRLSVSSSERGQFEELLKNGPQRRVLLSTCGLNPGDSGGPLVDKKGRLVAVSFATPRSDGQSSVNLDIFSYHVHISEVAQFLKVRPLTPMVEMPSPWIATPDVMTGDITSDGQTDTLVLKASQAVGEAVFLFDLDQDSDQVAVEAAETLAELRTSWDFEFSVSDSTQRHVFYDTNNDGTIDLILTDADADGFADNRWTLVGDNWEREAQVSSKLPLFDLEYFDKSVRDSISKQFSICVATLSKLAS